MNYNHFFNLSCYEEFEIQTALNGISKIDILKEIGYKIDDYYFFVSEDGIFNWYDLNGNHVENLDVLKELKEEHIPANIIKCIIPNSVISIGDKTFSYCESLKEINIPDSVKNIGYDAFRHCTSLKEINIPDSVTSIGSRTFYYCKSLKEVFIPNSVISIGHYAFWNCKSLKEITIPNNVISIGDDAFDFCNSLKEVIFKGKALEEIKRMEYYPFGIKDENVFKFS